MDLVLRTMNTEMTVAFVGGTSTFMVAFCLLRRQQAARPSCWPVAMRLLDSSSSRAMVITSEKTVDKDNIGVVYDCIVCLCEVSPGDKFKNLPNCDHGLQFHAHCIDAWLKDHSTCPICRSHISRPLSQRLQVYFCEHLLQDVVNYCNSALDNVATSIGDCRDF